MSRAISIAGVSLELEEHGTGQPLLFLHPGEGLQPERSWFNLLARRYRVIAPHHPGWGKSALPAWLSSVDDVAYLYLDLAEELDLTDATLVGADFGGWIAAEMAVRDTQRFARLVLVDPLGIKVGGVMDRDIADMHALPQDEYMRLAWADPANGERDLTQTAGNRACRDRPRARGVRAVRLEAIYAQPAPQALAAPHRHPDAAAMGRAGRHCQCRILPRVVSTKFLARGSRRSPLPVIFHIGNSPRRSANS